MVPSVDSAPALVSREDGMRKPRPGARAGAGAGRRGPFRPGSPGREARERRRQARLGGGGGRGWSRRAAGSGDDPAQRRVGDQGDAGAGSVAGAQPLPGLGADVRPSSAAMSAVSTGCSRLPAAKTPGVLARRALSTRALGWRGRYPGGGAGELVVGDPVPGGDDGVPVDGAPDAAVEILDLHRLHPVLAVDPGHAGPGRPRGRGRRGARRRGTRRRTRRPGRCWSSRRSGSRPRAG